MLSDRSYMRHNYPRPEGNALFWLLSVLIAAFLMQFGITRLFQGSYVLFESLGASSTALRSGHLWTLLTHGILHDPNQTTFILYVLGNGLALYFLGKQLLPVMGTRRFFSIYAIATAVGGLAWSATHWASGAPLMGSAAGVAALWVIFACFYPNQQMTLLLLFIFPVTVKPKYIAFGLVGFALLGFSFYEVMQARSPFGFAHSAHLGGMLVGWIYYRYVHNAQVGWPWKKAHREMPRRAKKSTAQVSIPDLAPPVIDLTNRVNLRAEVDRILDKINSHGFGALTADEKRLLDEAKDQLSRR